MPRLGPRCCEVVGVGVISSTKIRSRTGRMLAIAWTSRHEYMKCCCDTARALQPGFGIVEAVEVAVTSSDGFYRTRHTSNSWFIEILSSMVYVENPSRFHSVLAVKLSTESDAREPIDLRNPSGNLNHTTRLRAQRRRRDYDSCDSVIF